MAQDRGVQPDMRCTHCIAYLKRIEDLQFQVATLRDQARENDVETDTGALSVAFRMTRQEASIALMLYRAGRALPFWHLEENRAAQRGVELLGSNSIKVVIHRARRKLGGKDTIDHVWGTGYVMTPAGRAKIDAALHA